MALLPILVIVAILAAVGVLGFGAGDGKSQQQVKQEVTALLAGIPQEGATLGSPAAPITLAIYADLECPTVKLFVEKYLPSMVDRWVRTGDVKLEYHSLQTDTYNEPIFFRQEIAALAAGRQDTMWNVLLTFVYEQGEHFTEYATDEFLAEIASGTPGLKLARWRRDRKDPLLSRRVALDVYSAHRRGLRYTPSFVLESSSDRVGGRADTEATASLESEFKASLIKEVESLRREAQEEASKDIPGLRFQP